MTIKGKFHLVGSSYLTKVDTLNFCCPDPQVPVGQTLANTCQACEITPTSNCDNWRKYLITQNFIFEGVNCRPNSEKKLKNIHFKPNCHF